MRELTLFFLPVLDFCRVHNNIGCYNSAVLKANLILSQMRNLYLKNLIENSESTCCNLSHMHVTNFLNIIRSSPQFCTC